MAQLDFYANDNLITTSGLGFYGSAFSSAVTVGEYQGTSYITNAAGTFQGPMTNNIKYLNSASGLLNSMTSGLPLRSIPNQSATLQARFTHSTAVRTQNAKLRMFDRVAINNDPSGVTCKVAELIHPGPTQIETGSGSATWEEPTGSSTILSLISSPGYSGYRPSGSSTSDTTHDWFLALSASPDSIGSKLWALYLELEYL